MKRTLLSWSNDSPNLACFPFQVIIARFWTDRGGSQSCCRIEAAAVGLILNHSYLPDLPADNFKLKNKEYKPKNM